MAMQSDIAVLDAAAEQIFPCTVAQRRIWAIETRYPQCAALNIAIRWRLEGRFQTEMVEKALQQCVQRHESLRTRIVERNGDLVQCIVDDAPFKLSVFDLTRLNETERQAQATSIGLQEARAPFDVRHAPLFRATLTQLDADTAILLTTMHHIVSDGWSVGVLARDFGSMISAMSGDAAAALTPLDMQYADYALWQREFLASGALEPEKSYWRKQLRGLRYFEVPGDRPRGEQLTFDAEIRTVMLPLALSDKLDGYARSHGETMFSVAASCLAIALQLVTGEDEVVIGTQVAGRDEVDLEPIFGLFISTLVLRFAMDREVSVADGVARGSRVVKDALFHQRLPFEVLVETLNPPDDSARTPLYSVNFNLQRSFIEGAQYGAVRLVDMPSHSAGALYDLNFFMVGRPEGWRISCELNTNLYDAATVDRLLQIWRMVMETVAKRPSMAIAELEHALAPGDSRKRAAPAPLAVGASAQNDASANILCLQPEGDGTPIIALNNTSIYYTLAQAIGDARPFIDVQYRERGAGLPADCDFEEIADECTALIRLAQPHGPYIIFGLCVHGVLAFAAAERLKAAGETVELVIVADAWAPGYIEAMPPISRFIRRWQVRYHLNKRQVLKLWRRKITPIEFIENYGIVKRSGLLDFAWDRGWLKQKPFQRANADNAGFIHYLQGKRSRYRTAPYDGDVLVLRSDDPKWGPLFSWDMGWSPLVTGRISVCKVPGMHGDMFHGEGARVVGAKVNAMLALQAAPPNL